LANELVCSYNCPQPRGKHPIAKLVPYHPVGPKRQFGALRGVVSVGPEFFEPLPTDGLAAWEQ
jgi:antitoxin (DNA-binding transcriptional repressor) of toxin-antitoxin stability system